MSFKRFSPRVFACLCLCGLLDAAVARTAAATTTHRSPNGLDPPRKASSAPQPTAPYGGSSDGGLSSIWKDLSLMFRVYQQCANENLSVCLKVKLLTGLEKVGRTPKTLKLVEGVQFVSSALGEGEPEGPPKSAAKAELSEKEIEAVLPRANDAKDHVLNHMILKKLAGFLQDHTLQVRFPDIRRALDGSATGGASEGRGEKKDKKGNSGAFIMIPLLLGGTFIPIAYGALAILAGKALIVSKLALVLASIIGIKKLLSGGGKESQHEVVVQSGGHSGWGRDIDLAYSGWKPGRDAAKHM